MVILELECWREIKYSWIGDFDVHERSAELNNLGFYKTSSHAKKNARYKYRRIYSMAINKISRFKCIYFGYYVLSRNHYDHKEHKSNLFV